MTLFAGNVWTHQIAIRESVVLIRYVMAGVHTQIKCVALTITAGATDDVRKGSFIVISYSN